MRTSSFAALAACVILLAACAASPTLDERLAGKPAAERQAILADACHTEAGKGGNLRTPALFYSHVKRMRDICNHMAQEFSAAPSSSGLKEKNHD